MKCSFLVGCSLLLVSVIYSLAADNVIIAVKLSGTIGGIFILLSAIFTGSLASGDRIRANHATETPEDRRTRVNWAVNCALVGGPNLLAAIAILLFSR